MLVYMIYEMWEGGKNQGFIEMFQKEGVHLGISFLFVPYEVYKGKKLPDMVLNRTRKKEVSLWYEERGIPVLHEAALVELGNDKWKTFCHVKGYLKKQKEEKKEVEYRKKAGKCNVRDEFILPDTLYLPELSKEKFYKAVIKNEWHRGENLVLKTVDGHGGNEVFLLKAEDLEQTFYEFENRITGRNCIVQEQIKSCAMDVRVYVVGNQIYHGVLRKGKNDFRSNFSLGGSVREYLFSEQERFFLEKFLKVFSEFTLGMVGMDFILTEDGTFVFNELEEMVGCRMLYSCTAKEIVKDYVGWIAKVTASGKFKQKAL